MRNYYIILNYYHGSVNDGTQAKNIKCILWKAICWNQRLDLQDLIFLEVYNNN